MRFDVKFPVTVERSLLSRTRSVPFQGRGAVHMLETGLVVEGGLPRFTIPFIGRFYAPLLCAETARTLPYARITSHRYSGHWMVLGFLRIVVLIALTTLLGLGAAAILSSPTVDTPIVLGVGGIFYVILLFALLCHGRRTHWITFNLPAGGRRRIGFQIQRGSRKQNRDFIASLADYRAAANGDVRSAPPAAVTAVALLALLFFGARAQADEGEDFLGLLIGARKASKEQRWEDAERLATQAIERLATLPPDIRLRATGEAWNLRGTIRLDCKRAAESQEDFDRALEAFEAMGDKAWRDRAVVHLNRGAAFMTLQAFERAEGEFRRRIELLESQVGADSWELAVELDRLANSLERQKNFADAMPIQQRALQLRETRFRGAPHDDILNNIFRLADNRQEAKDLPGAKEWFDTLDQKMVQRFGVDSPQRRNVTERRRDVARELQDAATVTACEATLKRLGEVEAWSTNLPAVRADMSAEQLEALDQPLAKSEAEAAAFGAESLPVFTIGLHRARWLQSRKRFEEALAAYVRLDEIGGALYAEAHPERGAVSFLRGESLAALGRSKEAEAAYRLADERIEDSGFADLRLRLNVKFRLAQYFFQSKQHSAALPWYRRYLKLRGENGMEPDAEAGLALNQLGVCHTSANQWTEALACFEQSLAVLERTLPAEAPLLGTVRQNLQFAQSKPSAPPAPATDPASPSPAAGATSEKNEVGSPTARPLTVPLPPAFSPASDDSVAVRAREMAVAVLMLGVYGAIALVPASFIGFRAWQRGYGCATWMLAFLCSGSTPIITACILATLADRTLSRRRQKLRNWLDYELTSVTASRPTSGATSPPDPLPQQSLGDKQTQE